MRFAGLLLVSLFYAIPVQNQTTQAVASTHILTISGEVERPLKLSANDLAKLPRKSVQARDHDQKEATFEGFELREALKLAGVGFGESLRGKNLALYLLVEASDGYRAVFALPELDEAFRDRVILVADRRDNKPLTASEGPLRLVVADEKRHARWVRQVSALIIRRAE
jgi:DMSO/TMAO reductase YedYZ molybdopterin-dependent catalytic subunit